MVFGIFWWWDWCGDAPSIVDGDGVSNKRHSRWRRRRRRQWVRRPAAQPGRRFPSTARAPRKTNLPSTHRLALEKKFVHHSVLSNREYDHSAAAEDEHASLITAGASAAAGH